MSSVISFFLGAVLGGFLGMICTALMVAGRDDRE